MRIWHKDMVQVLPDKQLLGQWRELCAIASNIKNKRTPNHLLVNKVIQFPESHLYTYASLVFDELCRRGFNPNWQSFESHLQDKAQCHYVSFEDLFNTQDIHWHTPRYFWQCYYNLQEKLDCGGIKPMEWQAIYNLAVSFRKGGETMKQVKDFPDWTSIHFRDTSRVILKKDLQQMSPDQVASLDECYILDIRKEGKMLQLLI